MKWGILSPVYIEGKFHEAEYGFHSWPYHDWPRGECHCGAVEWQFALDWYDGLCWDCYSLTIDWDAPDVPF